MLTRIIPSSSTNKRRGREQAPTQAGEGEEEFCLLGDDEDYIHLDPLESFDVSCDLDDWLHVPARLTPTHQLDQQVGETQNKINLLPETLQRFFKFSTQKLFK